jgi:hypothetical protein
VAPLSSPSVLIRGMMKFRFVLLSGALSVVLSACSAGPALFGPQTGTVTGHVTSRACGGAYRLDQNPCQVSPRSGVQLRFAAKGSSLKVTGVDNNGSYRIDLAPGSYAVTLETFGSSLSNGTDRRPRFAGPSQITVSAGKTVTADFTETIQLL